MPTYSYECRKCGHVVDVFHAMTAKPRVKCAQCGGGCRRLLGTGAGIIFKGSGFYETDYKKGNGKDKAASESKGETKSETKSEAKTETKTATNTESKGAAKSKD